MVSTTPKAPLCLRLTHKYNTGYAYLDDHQEIGQVRFIGETRRVSDGESFRASRLFSVASTFPPASIKQALIDIHQQGCQCIHDCCGHMQTYATAAHRIGQTSFWLVRVHGFRNV